MSCSCEFRRLLRITCLGAGISIIALAALGRTAWGDEQTEVFERILILPVIDMSDIHGVGASLSGPLSGEVFITGVVGSEAVDVFGSILRNRLMGVGPVQWLEPDAGTITSMIGIAPLGGPREARIAAIQAAGRNRRADGVFCTYLYVFQKRFGKSYGVEAPARVAFESVLVSVVTGRVVWQESFTVTQKTLNENLLQLGEFFRRKGRWITAEEMAGNAADEMVEKLSAFLVQPAVEE